MSQRSRIALPGVGLTIAALALTACGGGSVGGGGGQAEGTVTTVINGDPSGFNPFMYRTTNDAILETFLYDTLLRMDDGNTLVPALASEWKAKSASSYTFTIRNGATCADGTPITAEVVANSLSVLADPKTAAAARSLIFGAGDATISADGDTVSIELNKPYSELPRGMSMAQSGIVCPAGLEDQDALNTSPVEGAYSGPYVLKKTEPGVGYELALREDYDQWPEYETDLPGEPPRTVNVTVSADPSTVANRLTSGDLDFGVITNDNVERFEDDSDFNIKQAFTYWVFVVFNQREGSPFHDNLALRTAVAQAISRQSFSNATTDGRAPLLSGIGTEDSECVLSDESLLVPTDTDAAKQKLSGVDLKMIGYTSLPGAVAIQEALNAVGANVDLNTTDTAGWATAVTQQTVDWDLTVMGGNPPLLQSLTRIMGTPAEDGGRSISGVRLPDAEKALDAGLAADTPEAKCAAFQDAQRAVLKDVAAVPLVALPDNVIIRDGVDVQVLNGEVDYKTIRITG
ncbi:ABC transporter substrate-binding protein (plasmid) [Nocardioides sp. R1-1]|uniref:ABC transporter substrate-binding protein n=1 Tax=Nocardioides sp. R1-1 TaxID=3383502 RepID=UPI0038D06325